MKASRKTLWLLLGFLALVAAFVYSANRSIDVMTGLLDGSFLDSSSEDYSISEANVAVLPFEGVIMGSREWLELIDQVKDRENIKGVIIRINSPGGAVAPAQEIFDAVLKLRQSKKVYCSMEDVAASGGYYIAAACEKIFANPGTLTGSIGVIMSFVNLKSLFQWAKVEPMTLKAGKFKDIGSQERPMRDDERALLQAMLDEVHRQFKDAIKQGRPALDAAVIEEYGDGRILTGAQAKSLGFVDEMGGLAVSYDHMKTDLDLKELKPTWVRPKKSRLPSWLESHLSQKQTVGTHVNVELLGKELSQALGRWIPQLSSSFEPAKPYLLPYHWFDSEMSALSQSGAKSR